MVNLIIAEVIIKNVPKNKKIRKMLLRPAKNSKQYFFERKNPQNSKPFYFCSTSFFKFESPFSIKGPYLFSSNRLENFSHGYHRSLKFIYH